MIVEGGGAPRIFDLDPGNPITVGRSRSNTIVVEDDKVSRVHARIYFESGQWFARDNQTLNGTHVGGVAVTHPIPLSEGLEITIASVRLIFGTGANLRAPPASAPVKDAMDSSDSTSWQADELAVLHTFMTHGAETNEPRKLIVSALGAILQQTRATLCGFMSLDQDENLFPRVVLPDQARVNVVLSKQLIRRVQSEDKTVWLKATRPGEIDESGSLMAFDDAMCVPLKAEGAPFGALHVYRASKSFNERDVRFCEMVAGYLSNVLARLRKFRSLEAENSRLKRRALVSEELVGDSTALQQLRLLIAKAAACSSTVSIHGETGAGKELVGQAIHQQSNRSGGPFVVVNCGAIAANLLEAELFGHAQGAFTGATRYHRGFFEQADEGTLFLDEIGDMSLDCQVKVLRAIEGKSFRPVGASEDVNVNVRAIAASHRDLAVEMQAGRFRQDLFYRLRVICLEVPPLREHIEDLPVLVERFLAKFQVENGRTKKLTPSALERLKNHSWPGNVRELRTVLESAVMLTDGVQIDAADLWLQSPPAAAQPASLRMEDVEEWAIREALKRNKGNISAAARALELSRETLTQKIKKYGIPKEA
jgi:Nif-specific regulatory protein